jgi:lipopolysaccharide/colanic/teichoic acid biosynthesis glycosyltransferase
VLAQCVVGLEQEVPPGSTLRQTVLLPGGSLDADAPSSALDPALPEWSSPAVPAPAERPLYPLIKRGLDASAAAAGIVLLFPLGIAIAALLKLESRGRGPVFFAHQREGRGGRPFHCWKFRTMVPNADVQQRHLARLNEVDGPQFRIEKDPRRTRVGRALSALNLDELPQLWNVLKGEMSLVGPRPSPFRENQVCVPWREGRLSVRPGITGLWQVCRHDRGRSDFYQWIYYDLLYVRNLSAWLDAKILVSTFLAPARGGFVPLAWLLAPESYHERRRPGRREDVAERAPDDRVAV